MFIADKVLRKVLYLRHTKMESKKKKKVAYKMFNRCK